MSGEEGAGTGNAAGGSAEYKELDVDGAVVELEQCEPSDSPVVYVSIVLRGEEIKRKR